MFLYRDVLLYGSESYPWESAVLEKRKDSTRKSNVRVLFCFERSQRSVRKTVDGQAEIDNDYFDATVSRARCATFLPSPFSSLVLLAMLRCSRLALAFLLLGASSSNTAHSQP